MTDTNANSLNETLFELRKLIEMMDEDASNLSLATLIGDYVAPILDSMVSEIELNRQYTIQTNDRVSLALMMSEKTFLGDVLTNIAEHFSTVIDELPDDTDPESKLGVAVGEIQDLLATWMSFDGGVDNEDEDDDEEDYDGDESADGSMDESVEGVVLEDDSETEEAVDAES